MHSPFIASHRTTLGFLDVSVWTQFSLYTSLVVEEVTIVPCLCHLPLIPLVALMSVVASGMCRPLSPYLGVQVENMPSILLYVFISHVKSPETFSLTLFIHTTI